MSHSGPEPRTTSHLPPPGASEVCPAPRPPDEEVEALRARLEAAERELHWHRAEAERLAREGRRLEARLLEAERLREAVLGSLSHELRTPLTAILGWAQLLRSGRAGPASLQRACESIERNAKLQARLIEDLLDASRLAEGRLALQREPLPLSVPVERAVAAVRPMAEARGVDLVWEPEPFGLFVAGDPARLEQVVRHLVDNAVKFSPHGGRVEVRTRSDGQQAELLVTDQGPGIPEDFRPFLFERFRQADPSATRAHGGLGLGLSLVRQLVELHGGTVEAERPAPAAGGPWGARFVVRLPLAGQAALPPPELTLQDGTVGVPSLEGVTVLLVDDDPESLEVVAGLLATSGARVVAVRSAHEALGVVECGEPDILLADLRMPGQDGFELLRRVRAREASGAPALPAVALTAASSAADRARAVAAGFHFHVPKPVDRAELALVVRRLVPAAPARSALPQAG